MTRRPGALPGRIAGDAATQSTRLRRQRQKDSVSTGGRLGAGLREDSQGRLALNQIKRIDPADPDFNAKLVAQLVDRGIMEK